MTLLNKLFQRARGGVKEVAFWYAVFAFFCLQAFILSGFSGLYRLWQMSPGALDWHRVAGSVGLAWIWTGLSLAVVWWLLPERWRRPLLARFPSRRRNDF